MHRRSGLTLIELLVVVMVLGVLLALLLTAAESSREAARRAACQNHLHQIAAAVLANESTNRMLPPLYNGSFLPQPRHGFDEFHFHSWRTAILPQLEQSSVFASLNLAQPSTAAANQTGINVNLSVFLCPSTANVNTNVPEILEWNDGESPIHVIGSAARNDYEAVGGVRVLPQTGMSSDLSIIRFGAWGEPKYKINNGSSIRYRKALLADVTDGLSNTLLAAERAGGPDLYRRGHSPDPFPYHDPNNKSLQVNYASAISTHFWWMVYDKNQPINESNRTGIYAFHPGGANVAFADGSVKFLKETTSTQVLTAFGTRAGGEVVSAQ
jgi:prepilin-type processing-associated H-X9-DG protein/prepilin-type N-terminal cleavage/methylation domain-containing protein